MGQGPITLQSAERLASTKWGIGLVRRQFKEQVRIVAEGRDTVGLSFDEGDAVVRLTAGNYIVGPDTDPSAIPLWAET